jgi:LytS/YehU family sensor histidine kinase
MKKQKHTRILQHVGFWMLFILLFVVIYGPVFNNYPWLFLSSMVMLPFTMALVYIINYRILPLYMKRKRYIRLGFIMLVILATEPLLIRMLVMILSGEGITLESLVDYNLLPFYFETGLIVFIAFSIKLFKESIREREEKAQLEKQKLQAELTALRSQLNAHFLFNTLNNLYGLAMQKSDRAPQAILMLSEMLNFVLYECSADSYSLNKELDFINNYMELEKLRYGKRLKIHLEKALENREVTLAPLLLFPFVENSFKHGTSKMIRKVWIRMRIRTTKDLLLFEVENSKRAPTTEESLTEGGVGLENVKKRLEILYPLKHSLLIREDDSSFSITLTIQINSKK